MKGLISRALKSLVGTILAVVVLIGFVSLIRWDNVFNMPFPEWDTAYRTLLPFFSGGLYEILYSHYFNDNGDL